MESYDAFNAFIETVADSGCNNFIVHHAITRHLHGLYKHTRGSNAWKRYLSTHAHKQGAGVQVLKAAREQIDWAH